MELKGKTVVITGATSGLGQAAAIGAPVPLPKQSNEEPVRAKVFALLEQLASA
jgi:hypothetical protein